MSPMSQASVEVEPPISCETCAVRKYAVYRGLKGQYVSYVTALRQGRSVLKKGQMIFRECDLLRTVYTLFDGWAFKYRMRRDGTRQIFTFYMPGDLLVAQAASNQPLTFSVRALTPVTLCAFDANAYFSTIMSDPNTRKGLRDHIFDRQNETDDLVMALGRQSASVRISCFLNSLVERMERRGLGVDGTFRMPISQGLLADTLGLTQVYVNQIVRQFRYDGVVEVSRNQICVVDAEALRVLMKDGS